MAKEEKERYELLAKKMHAKVSLSMPSLMAWLLVMLSMVTDFLLEIGKTPKEGEAKQAAKGALNKEKYAKYQHFTSSVRHLWTCLIDITFSFDWS